MKKIKGVLSGFIATATLLTATAFPVSADYDNCDVNRDGTVGVADLTILNKYLGGIYSVPNYNQLDVNRSLTVDAADTECLEASLFGDSYNGAYFSRATGGILPAPTVSGFTPNSTASSTAGREYMRYEYETGHVLDTYTLTPTIANLNSGVNSRSVIGTDSRTPSYGSENKGIVRIDAMDNEGGGATGFIVGDHLIATAAHCVYKKGNDIPHHWKRITVSLYDENGVVTDVQLHPVEAHIPVNYVETDDSTYDYALITVSEDLSDINNTSLGENYECTFFSLGTPYNVSADAYSNVPIYVTGSPKDLQDDEAPTRLFTAQGNIINEVIGNYPDNYIDVLYHNVDTEGGDSGSPIYTITKHGNYYTYTAIAIHNNGSTDNTQNWGSTITNYHLQFYYNNPNMSYILPTE